MAYKLGRFSSLTGCDPEISIGSRSLESLEKFSSKLKTESGWFWSSKTRLIINIVCVCLGYVKPCNHVYNICFKIIRDGWHDEGPKYVGFLFNLLLESEIFTGLLCLIWVTSSRVPLLSSKNILFCQLRNFLLVSSITYKRN